jgi:hypothetical protein
MKWINYTAQRAAQLQKYNKKNPLQKNADKYHAKGSFLKNFTTEN